MCDDVKILLVRNENIKFFIKILRTLVGIKTHK